MSLFLKLFNTTAEYNAYTADTANFIKPNVSCILDDLGTVHYNPWVETRVVAKFNVTDTSSPTQLYTYMNQEEAPFTILGVDMFDKVEIDGTEVSIQDLDTTQGQYQLSTNEHTVKYTLKDPTMIGVEIDEETGILSKVGATFMECNAITSVIIPNSVTSIGENAFDNCTSLTSIDIPNSVTSIGNGAFYDCSSLTSIDIPDTVTSIGDYAFRECRSLTSINNIPNSVTSIGNGVFQYCSSLTSVTIGNSVTSIGENAFDNCRSLTSLTIGNGVTSIGDYAFTECTSLTSIDIPNSVTSIGDAAFSNCSGLTSVTVNATTPPTLSSGSGAFNNTNNCPIYVPSGSVNAYKSSSNWSYYASRIQAIP